MPSFTAQVPNLQQIGPIVEVQITIGPIIREILVGKGEPVPAPVTVLAMIDTGATKTVISKSIAAGLNLKPVGTSRIDTSSDRNVACYNYLVSLVFPNNVVIKETVVVGAPLLGQHISCLIGRDVLAGAVFIYTGYANSFTLSF